MLDEFSKSLAKSSGRGISKLDSKQRVVRATTAALVRAGYIKTDWVGELQIAGATIGCAVLPDGRRVLVQREVVGLLTGHKKGALARYLQPVNLRPYAPEKFRNGTFDDTAIPIVFRGSKAHGFEGEDLVALCRMYINARRDNALLPGQKHLADKAEAIIMSLANVGIAGLIDEATGYQEVRDRHALQALLDRYLRKEYAAWTKRFPDEFFKEMFRLKGWNYPTVGGARPGVVGKYINNLVYERLAPGLLRELEEKNPKGDSGYRRVKHHQWLSDDVGHPALTSHIHAVAAFMRASHTWEQMLKLMDQAFPRKGDTLPLLED